MSDILHIYGQDAWHDDVVIAGTPNALQQLVVMLQDALNHDTTSRLFFVNDGEGFKLRIAMVADDGNLAVPYTNPMAREERSDAIWP